MTAAAALVWLCWQDRPAIQARDDFEALPPFDYAYEAGELFKKNRFTEALLLVDEGLAKDPANNRLLVMKQGLETGGRFTAEDGTALASALAGPVRMALAMAGDAPGGTGFSTIGHTGSPVTRSKVKMNELLIVAMTALMRRPLTVMSARIGEAARS